MKRSFSFLGYLICFFLGEHNWSLMWIYDEKNWHAQDCKRCGYAGVDVRDGKHHPVSSQKSLRLKS